MPDAVRAAVSEWLNTRNRAVIRFHSEKSVRPANAMTLDRLQQPPLGADWPFVAPAVKSTKLENGLEVLVVERDDLPKLNVTVVTRAGAVADPAGKAGVAQLTTTVIDLAWTKTRNALQVEEAFADLGTTLTGGAGRESARVGLDVLKRNLSPALAILADVVQNATFPEPEVAREKKRLLDAIAQQDCDANALATRIRPDARVRAGASVRPARAGASRDGRKDHARGPRRVSPGTVEAGVLCRHLRGRRHAGRSHGPREAVFRHVDRRRRAAHHGFLQPPAHPRPALYIVYCPDAAQTVVSQWLSAPERTSPDYDALKLADAVWGGGGFGTRLNLNLREGKRVFVPACSRISS